MSCRAKSCPGPPFTRCAILPGAYLYCQAAIGQGPLAPLLTSLPALLSKAWLGKRDDPQAPAAIAAKLGYDLFTTAGAKPTFRETLISVLSQDGVKELLKWISAIAIAAILLWLGLKP